MNGPVSVELLLAPATEAMVRAEWIALEARGLSSLAAYKDPSNRPHISLRTGIADDAVERLDDRVLVLPFPVTLGPPVLFGSGPRRVLARSVVPSRALLDLHTSVHEGLATDVAETSAWMPHVTLARRIQLSSIERALELIDGDIAGTAIGMRRWNSEARTVTQMRATDPTVR